MNGIQPKGRLLSFVEHIPRCLYVRIGKYEVVIFGSGQLIEEPAIIRIGLADKVLSNGLHTPIHRLVGVGEETRPIVVVAAVMCLYQFLAGFLGEVFPGVTAQFVVPGDLSGKADDGAIVQGQVFGHVHLRTPF